MATLESQGLKYKHLKIRINVTRKLKKNMIQNTKIEENLVLFAHETCYWQNILG